MTGSEKEELRRESSAVREVVAKISSNISKLKKILSLNEEEQLKLAVAVSGGMDSVVLLDALRLLSSELRLDLHILHVDHNLRESSSADAEFVKGLAQDYKLPVDIYVAEPHSASSETSNVEAWARNIRYDFLELKRAEFSAHAIVVAHHRNDLAETLLFKLLSGRLATSSYTMTAFDASRCLFRPLLNVSKENLVSYSEDSNLDFVFDETNLDVSRTRNKIRHDLVPLLKSSYNSNLDGSLGVLAARLNNDEDALWGVSLDLKLSASQPSSIQYLKTLVPGIRWRVLRLLAEEMVGVNARKLGYRVLSNLSHFIEDEVGEYREADIGFGLRFLINEEGNIVFLDSELKDSEEKNSEYLLRNFDTSEFASEAKKELEHLSVPGKIKRIYEQGEVASEISAEVLPFTDLSSDEKKQVNIRSVGNAETSSVAYFDAGVLDGDLFSVRERESGDVVDVINRGRRKLKKLLQEAGLRLVLRDTLPIVLIEGSVLWVPGVSRSSRAQVGKDTEFVLRFKYERQNLTESRVSQES